LTYNIQKKTNMKQRNIQSLILLFAALTLAAQSNSSPCYTNNTSKDDTTFSQDKYTLTRTCYANSKQCKGGNFNEAQSEINQNNANSNPAPKLVYSQKDTIKNPKARGNEFDKWVHTLLRATDDYEMIDTSKLNGTSVNFILKEGESISDLAEAIVASYDLNDDKKIDFDEFLTKAYSSTLLLSVSGSTYMSKQFYRSLDDIFLGFDINESFNKKFTLDVNEVAANLWAMSGNDLDGRKPKMYIDGQELMHQMNFMMFHGEADPEFREVQEITYENIK